MGERNNAKIRVLSMFGSCSPVPVAVGFHASNEEQKIQPVDRKVYMPCVSDRVINLSSPVAPTENLIQ